MMSVLEITIWLTCFGLFTREIHLIQAHLSIQFEKSTGRQNQPTACEHISAFQVFRSEGGTLSDFQNFRV